MKGDAAGQIATDGTWSDATREAFADRIEAILARHIKDFDQIKLARRAYAPADLERMNVNLVGGDPYGGQCSIDQFFLFRPFAHSSNGTGTVRGCFTSAPRPIRGRVWAVDRASLPQRDWVHDRRRPRSPRGLAASGRDRACELRALSDEPHHGALQLGAAR
ncbi:hypothetical protein ACFSHQ_06160 [Gemmobacter lanyuensis]